ncbi:hypothetical protein NDU88_005112 [Pleurodeles waltl]|uniref:Uncharacterized protein n=1 Tax=Pleurodeles waltl TaxID=8319 RepID=A0AAV7TUI3_PLEWA|nr:hypothetical protein NDU88_005112 [Pleurodeles waltl]
MPTGASKTWLHGTLLHAFSSALEQFRQLFTALRKSQGSVSPTMKHVLAVFCSDQRQTFYSKNKLEFSNLYDQL